MRIALLTAIAAVLVAFVIAVQVPSTAAQPLEPNDTFGAAGIGPNVGSGEVTGDASPGGSDAPDGPAQVGSWRRQSSTTRSTLRDVSFVDYRYGWAVGGERDDDCVIVATKDGGRKWARQGCPIGWRMQAVDFVDRQNGWAVGLSGTILRTHDGGATWGVQGSGTRDTLTAIQAWDTNVVWVTSRDGAVYKTTNGGASWRSMPLANASGLLGVSFVDPAHGWVVGSGGTVLGTSDGGENWRRLRFPGDDRLLGISMVNLGLGYAVGNDVYFTVSGGDGWGTQADLGKTLEDVHALDANYVWAVGDEGTIGHTTDGKNWVREAEGITTRGLRAVHFVDVYDGWAVGTGGLILHFAAPRPTDTPRATKTPIPTNTPTPTLTPSPSPTPTPSGPWVWAGREDRLLMLAQDASVTVRMLYGNMPAPTTLSVTVDGPVALGEDGVKTVEVPAPRPNGLASLAITAVEGAEPGSPFTFVAERDGTQATRRGVIAFQVMLPAVIDH